MIEMDWVNVVSTVGFPIAVSAYLLLRFEKVIIENTKAVQLIAMKMGVHDGE